MMPDDVPEADIPASSNPVISASPHAAFGRPGETAPRMDVGDVPPDISEVAAAIAAAERLMAGAREPRHDAQWEHLEPVLRVEFDRLRRVLNEWWHANPDVAMFYRLKRILETK